MSPALSKRNNLYNARKGGMKVLVACGGTGGHIFPALSFIETLKSQQKVLDVIIVVTKRKIESRIVPAEYRIIYIDLSPISIGFNIKNLIAIIKLLVGTVQSIYIILRFHPNVVVGFGGYATFPLVFFAKVLRSKTIIHEQNVVVGVSNRILARFTDKIAISFGQTKEYLKAYEHKIILTGNPKRKDLFKVSKEAALDFFGFSQDKFTILVMGGSQGSGKINKVFLDTLLRIQNRKALQVIHLSGRNDFSNLSSEYKKMDITFKLFEFLKPMHYAYCAADLAITRAGATTISELIFFRLPAIIIPYPFAYQHQIANANWLTDKGLAILIEDRTLNSNILSDILIDLIEYRNKLNNMRDKYENLLSESYEEDLSDAVLSLMSA